MIQKWNRADKTKANVIIIDKIDLDSIDQQIESLNQTIKKIEEEFIVLKRLTRTFTEEKK